MMTQGISSTTLWYSWYVCLTCPCCTCQLSEEVEQLQEALMQFKTRSSPAKPMVQAQQDAGWAIRQLSEHIEAKTKWLTFSRRHIEMDFLEWKCMNFD